MSNNNYTLLDYSGNVDFGYSFFAGGGCYPLLLLGGGGAFPKRRSSIFFSKLDLFRFASNAKQ